MALVTVGHGTVAADAFVAMVRDARIVRIVDIRTAPGSRRFPWFRREEMRRWLPDAGIGYRWEQALGGFRKPAPDSPHTALRVPAFRGYADHMSTPGFREALDRVIEEAASQPTAVMCSESLWWRCHRRLLADSVSIVRGVEVVHLQHGGRAAPHRATEGVRREGDLLIYDAGQGRLARPGE